MGATKGIYKRGNVWWIRYAGADGKTRFESSKSSSFKDAENLLVKRRYEAQNCITANNLQNQSIKPNTPHITIQQLALKYERHCQHQKAFKAKKNVLKHVVQELGSQTITNNPHKRFKSKNIKPNYWKEVLSKSTVNRRMEVLRHMIRKAVAWELIPEDVHKKVCRVKDFPEHNGRLRYLTIEEAKRLIECCPEGLTRDVVTVALNTGMRSGEIFKLTWPDIDLVHGFILLKDTKNGKPREVPINHAVKDVFERVLKTRLEKHPYVFYCSKSIKTGKQIDNIGKSYRAALKRAGIEDFTFHDLRHTFASHLVMSGVPLIVVSKLWDTPPLQ
jgi:integrase